MPNNKKNRKKKKKATSAAAAAAPVGPTAAERSSLRCCHNPASCDQCAMAFPPGCLHSLCEDERMSSEIMELIPVCNRFFEEKDSAFWEQPENASFANERMVRSIFYQSVKLIVGKDRLFGNGQTGDYKRLSKMDFFFMLHLYFSIKLGSEAAVIHALDAEQMSSLDDAQVSIRAIHGAFEGCHECYYSLVYILNELSPCNCLEAEVERAKEEAEEEQGQGETLTLRCCSNGDCRVKEACNAERFSCCASCKMVQYCSRRCYKDHWRGDTTTAQPSHKIACKAIQELKLVLAGGVVGGSRVAMGDLV